MFNIFKINWKSVGKAAKDVGIGVIGVAVPASFAFLSEPEVFVPLVATLGPFGLLAAPGLAFAVKYLKDAYKHRNDQPVPEE